jgi:acyl carrier protein
LANVTAIIGWSGKGWSGRFPGELTLAGFWQHLTAGTGPSEPAEPAGTAGGGSAAEPWVSRTRLFCDAATEATRATTLDTERTGLFVVDLGGELASDVAAEMGLSGPVVTVSNPLLTAIERAGDSLGAGECDLALVGEVAIGGGVAGVLALKRLPRALADGDTILALIQGSALEPAPAPRPHAMPETSDAGETPETARERPALAEAFTPPANPLEAAIAGVWQEQLGLDRVGVDDNFFELGGTSIAGVKIIAILKDWLHQDIPTVSLYEGPTVSALAKVLLESGRAKAYDAVRERGERRRRKLQRLGHGAGPDSAG